MKKVYLNEMNNDKIKYLLTINEKLASRLNNDFLEIKMDWQSEDIKNTLGNNYHNYIKIHDHYNSFYMRLTDWERFIDYLNTDYLNNDDITIYNMIQEKREQLKELDFYSDEYDTIYEECEKLSIKLLESIENFLHTFEEWEDDEMIDYFQEMDSLSDYYIEVREDETSDNVVRLDVSYTETFI